jgi:hypothetical protein
MRANVGDEIIVDPVHQGEVTREGEVVEVFERGGVVYYRVRWDEGHETIFFPGPNAHAKRLGANR